MRNKEQKAAYDREYLIKNRKRINARQRAWTAKNRERRSLIAKKCYWKYRDRVAARMKARRDKNPSFRMAHNLRSRIRLALKGLVKNGHTRELLGCSFENFRLHIESNWEPGMTWENYGCHDGQWCLDHMIPCAVFDLTKPEHQKRCFHFSNIRPMWHLANISKGKKIISDQYSLL